MNERQLKALGRLGQMLVADQGTARHGRPWSENKNLKVQLKNAATPKPATATRIAHTQPAPGYCASSASLRP